MQIYAVGYLALCLLVGVACIIIACRANRDDLPAIVRAIMRMGTPTDDDRHEPPSLPKL
jgi:hypothetical protein